jgi:GTP cyclohydrolase II
MRHQEIQIAHVSILFLDLPFISFGMLVAKLVMAFGFIIGKFAGVLIMLTVLGASNPPQGDRPESPRVRRCVNMPILDGAKSSEIFSFYGLSDPKEHVAIAVGDWRSTEFPLVQVHSECLTGDVFGSCLCDCGPQLKQAFDYLQKNSGILIYLRQEGRGIGLYNKLDAYSLQSRGFDTYVANQQLNFGDDLRDYKPAADILFALGARNIRLLSNNRQKKYQLEQYGIRVVEQIKTGVFINRYNVSYLKAKVEKTNHNIDLPE